MDLDFGQDSEELKKLEVSKSTSKLDKMIKQLICMLFDIESMKKAMVEFEVSLLSFDVSGWVWTFRHSNFHSLGTTVQLGEGIIILDLTFDIPQNLLQIDLTKMPLGKLSRKQIESAYKILAEVQNLIKQDDDHKDNISKTTLQTKFLDASNRFFTLIPHDFGLNKPPLLNNPDYIKVRHIN